MEIIIAFVVVAFFGPPIFLALMRGNIVPSAPIGLHGKYPARIINRPAVKGQRIGTFQNPDEAREICESINCDSGDRMYVVGKEVRCDGPINVEQTRARMGDLHDDYWQTHDD